MSLSCSELGKKRLEPSGEGVENETPCKKPITDCTVNVTPLGVKSIIGRGTSKESVSAARRLDELQDTPNGKKGIFATESGKENTEIDVDEILSDSSELTDTSDEDEDTRLQRHMKKKKRIMETKQAILKKLAIVDSTKEIQDAILREKQIAIAKRTANKQRADILNKRKEGNESTESTFRRKSLRLLRKDPMGADLPEEPEEEIDPRKPDTEFPMVAVGFEEIGVKAGDENDNEDDKFLKKTFIDYEQFIGKIKSSSGVPDKLMEPRQEFDLDEYKESLKSLKIKPEHVQKVTKGRVFSIAIHPSRTETLIGVGDKYGNLGLWNPNLKDSNHGTYMFQPHIKPISCLKFSTINTNKLYSCSYDGQLRSMDLQKSVFEEAIINDESCEMSGFDFLESTHTIITSRSDGCLSIIDTRAHPRELQTFRTCDKAAKCVSCHPMQKSFVATSHRDGSVFIFDVRNMSPRRKCNPVVKVRGHTRSVSSAYFSPVIGKHLLTTSYDSTIGIFDTLIVTQSDVKAKSRFYHNNNTGRWLSSFRAAWHPNSDDIFVVGSMDRPRKIDIYDSSANYVMEVTDHESLGCVCSINCFHESRNILVGGNSSGRIYYFSDEV